MANSERRTAVRDYRALLRDKHRVAEVIGPESIDRAELVFNLSRLMNRLGQDFETLHRQNGISWSGFRTLNVLWTLGPVELRDIARLSGASRASIWSALKTLERDGLVSRTRDSADKRLVHLSLTDEGRAVCEVSIRAQAKREAEWFSSLSHTDATKLRLLLERLADPASPHLLSGEDL